MSLFGRLGSIVLLHNLNLLMHPLRRLTAAYQAELSERVVNVRLGGSEANLETIGNFLVAQSIADELDDFQFALS